MPALREAYMAKIPLTIDPSYCSTWGFWEGVRELIQNAKDADEFDLFEMSIQHSPRTDKLVVANKGVAIQASTLLLLGATSKTGSAQRGKFGEGFALGCLALVRAGHAVTIHNGDEVWRPSIEKAEEGPFAGQDLLVFQTRKLSSTRDAFSVEVEDVTKEIWAATKELFLFLEPPKTDDVVHTNNGSVLLEPRHKGRIFCKGIFVNVVDKVEYGYDLPHAQLDRDRRMVEEWDLKFKLADIMNSAHEAAPARFAPKVYEMLKKGSKEVEAIEYRADGKLLKALRASYEEEHGDAIPVTTMQESRALELVGAKTVVVNNTLKNMLKRSGLDAEVESQRRRDAVKSHLAWSALTEDEAGVCTRLVELLTLEYAVVEFYNETLATNVIEGNKIGIARWALSAKPLFLVKAVALCEAQRQTRAAEGGSGEVAEVLAVALLRVLNIPTGLETAPPLVATAPATKCGCGEPLHPGECVEASF